MTRYPVNPDAPGEGYDYNGQEHRSGLGLDAEPIRFVYTVEGEPYVGTATDLGHALEQAHYAGLDVGPLVWTFGPDGLPISHEWYSRSHDFDEDDYATVIVTVTGLPPELATTSYRIDGRA